MSSLRPAVRTASPDGRRWEIYAYKLRLPPRGAPGRRRVSRFLHRYGVALPRAIVAARTSDEWTIEARSWAPYPLAHRWSTTRELRGQVLASVEGALARGETPRPRNAKQLEVG